jgi:sterol desaturase/sphingolipid hydroxylase (fatty acid hydroxylase superfamily)
VLVGPLHIPALYVVLVLVGFPLIGFWIAHALLSRRRIERLGYSSRWEYLRAVPRSDAERKDAADLAARGLVICVLGLVFSPIVFIGAFPLYYGARKLAYALLGLGLVDEDPRDEGTSRA